MWGDLFDLKGAVYCAHDINNWQTETSGTLSYLKYNSASGLQQFYVYYDSGAIYVYITAANNPNPNGIKLSVERAHTVLHMNSLSFFIRIPSATRVPVLPS